MPRSGPEFPRERSSSALNSRELASLARRLSRGVTDVELRERLIAYAMELEAAIDAGEARPGKAEPLRMATGPVIWQDTPRSAPPPMPPVATVLSPRTDWLIRQAGQAIKRSVSIRQWQMTVRRPFDIRTAAV